jgi:oligopeptide transport system substrate-binding protein
MKRALIALILVCLFAAAAAQEALTEQGELVIAMSKSDIELDPHHAYSSDEAQLFTGLYEGLFVYDPANLDPKPALSESFVRSKDKKTYTFAIRKGARYSNGQPIKAQDIRASWLRMIDPKEGAEYSSLFDLIKGVRDYRLGIKPDPDKVGIKAPSDGMLVVDLESPAAYFTKLLCHHSFSLVHPSMLSDDSWKKVSGMPTSGPYSLGSVKPGEMTLVKNENYWDAANVLIPSIRIVFSNDDEDVTRRFNSGEIHWLTGAMNWDMLFDMSARQVTKPLFSTNYLYIRADEKPWNDERVRRALVLLLPWPQIRNPERYYVPADSLIAPIQGYPKVSGPTVQDEDEAKALLAKAGYPDGAGLPEAVIRLADSEDHKALAKTIQESWAAAGVKARIENLPSDEYFQSLKKKDYTLGSMTWIGDFSDPLTFLQMWTSDSNLNDAKYSSKAYDKLIAASMAQEGNARMKTLSEAEKQLLDSAVCIPLFHSIALNVISTEAIGGWYSNPLDIHPFKFLRFIASPPVQGIVLALPGE